MAEQSTHIVIEITASYGNGSVWVNSIEEAGDFLKAQLCEFGAPNEEILLDELATPIEYTVQAKRVSHDEYQRISIEFEGWS